jgi:hypothetical protein
MRYDSQVGFQEVPVAVWVLWVVSRSPVVWGVPRAAGSKSVQRYSRMCPASCLPQ